MAHGADRVRRYTTTATSTPNISECVGPIPGQPRWYWNTLSAFSNS